MPLPFIVRAAINAEVAAAGGINLVYIYEPPLCELPGNLTAIPATIRKIDNPNGAFSSCDGSRFDVCIMEVKTDPAIAPPYAHDIVSLSKAYLKPGPDGKLSLGKIRGPWCA